MPSPIDWLQAQSEIKVATLLKRKLVIRATLCLIAAALLAAAGCSKANSTSTPANPPDVEVVQVEQKDVPLYSEWIGTLDGMVNAPIKAQVSGYLLRQAYAEGSPVRKGQLLFEVGFSTKQPERQSPRLPEVILEKGEQFFLQRISHQ